MQVTITNRQIGNVDNFFNVKSVSKTENRLRIIGENNVILAEYKCTDVNFTIIDITT